MYPEYLKFSSFFLFFSTGLCREEKEYGREIKKYKVRKYKKRGGEESDLDQLLKHFVFFFF